MEDKNECGAGFQEERDDEGLYQDGGCEDEDEFPMF